MWPLYKSFPLPYQWLLSLLVLLELRRSLEAVPGQSPLVVVAGSTDQGTLVDSGLSPIHNTTHKKSIIHVCTLKWL